MDLTRSNIKQKRIKVKGEINKFTMIVEDFNTTLLIIDKIKHKISNDMEDLNINHCELIIIIRTFYTNINGALFKCTWDVYHGRPHLLP